jgi:restriction endonuclease S subunit
LFVRGDEVMLQSLSKFVKKKSIKATDVPNFEILEVLGVSNKLGITKTDHKKSKDISKYQLIEEGDFAYNPYRINVGSIGLAPKGTRGLVSPAYVVFKTQNLLPELLLDFLKSEEGLYQIKKYARGTVRKALRFDDLGQIEMPIPSIEKQAEILTKKNAVQKDIDYLLKELTYQQSLLKKLRQQILQEAIEGKLTKDWRKENPDVEPASELLKRIKAEKEQLFKDKKIKIQKLLPPITEKEKPFEIPESWEWCSLGEIAGIVRGGSPRPAGDKRFYDGNIPFLKVGDLTGYNNKYCSKHKYTIKEAGLHKTRFVDANTLMLTNSGATLGIPRICSFPTTFNDGIPSVPR